MTPASAVAILLALAVLVASARMLLGFWRSESAARPSAWRVVALLALQAAGACLLYWTLLPPAKRLDAGTMVVLTADADRADAARIDSGEHLIALPEASDATDAEHVPDLATALRRHPGVIRLHIVGAGLVARDRDAVQGRAIAFAPSPLPRGIVELWSPDRVQAGAQIRVSGRVEGVAGGSAELLDPGGVRSDRATLDKDGYFTLSGNARGAGFAAFGVRVRDAKLAIVEEAAVPLQVVDGVSRRVLILAGGPSPELKFLRRWATDAGLSLHTQITLGGGMQIGDAPIAFDAATLAGFDLLVLDERAWRSLGDARHAALRAAVRDGLGVLLRITGPLSAADRTRLRALGFAVETARVPETFRIASMQRAPADDAGDRGDTDSDIPALTRRALRIAAADGSPLLRDATGATLAVWRAEGRGRLAVWPLADTFRLVLAGHADHHGNLWSDAFTTLSRASGAREPVLEGEARQGQRVVVCGVPENSSIETPQGARIELLVDPISGSSACAGLWPTTAGWHRVRADDVIWPFHVLARDALPGVQARALREATARLMSADAAMSPSAATAPGRRWPWLIAWLAVSALLWWLERARHGRR